MRGAPPRHRAGSGKGARPGGGEDSVDQGVALVPCLQQEDIPCKPRGCQCCPDVPQPPVSTLGGPPPPPHSRSSSKWVSVPSGPGMAQTSRAFRKVVHLFTRLRCPPTSFCQESQQWWAAPPGTPGPQPTHSWMVLPGRSGQCGQSWSCPAPAAAPLPSRGRRSRSCRRRGPHSPAPKKLSRTWALGAEVCCLQSPASPAPQGPWGTRWDPRRAQAPPCPAAGQGQSEGWTPLGTGALQGAWGPPRSPSAGSRGRGAAEPGGRMAPIHPGNSDATPGCQRPRHPPAARH